MSTHLIPQNETLRVAQSERMQLAGVSLEDGLERVVKLASRMLDAPLAAYNVFEGDLLRVRAQVGIAPITQVASNRTLCSQLNGDTTELLVEDALADSRYADNVYVTGPAKLRFYAGVQVRDPDQLPLGTLCVMDTQPRKTNGSELQILSELAAIIEREMALRALLRTDPLTGLYNENHFQVEIEREWRRMGRSRAPISMITANVDRMGEFNETYGSERGDLALRRVAERLAQCFLRSGDFLVRLSGDTFLIVLPETGIEPTTMLAKELLEGVAKLDITHPFSASGKLTVSLGLAGIHQPAEHKLGHRVLLQRALAALSVAKRNGGNGLSVSE